MNNARYSWMLVAVLGLLLVGCNGDYSKESEKKDSSNVISKQDEHGHGHHVHGPNHGELFVIADTGLYGEWVAKYGQNLIQFYILDTDKITEKKIAADKLIASFKANEVMTFDISASEPDDEGMSSRFEIEDEQLALAMKTAGVNLEIEIDGKKYTIFLEKDPHF